MCSRTDGYADAAFASMVARSVTDENAALPHLVNKFWRTKSREHEICPAGPKWNSVGFQRFFQPPASFADFAHVLPDEFLVGECVRKARELKR